MSTIINEEMVLESTSIDSATQISLHPLDILKPSIPG